jgi:hypothetical protein
MSEGHFHDICVFLGRQLGISGNATEKVKNIYSSIRHRDSVTDGMRGEPSLMMDSITIARRLQACGKEDSFCEMRRRQPGWLSMRSE